MMFSGPHAASPPKNTPGRVLANVVRSTFGISSSNSTPTSRSIHGNALYWPLGERDALAMIVNRDGGLISVLHGPDDVLRAPRRVAAEEHARPRARERRAIHLRHLILELHAHVALDPRKRV